MWVPKILGYQISFDTGTAAYKFMAEQNSLADMFWRGTNSICSGRTNSLAFHMLVNMFWQYKSTSGCVLLEHIRYDTPIGAIIILPTPF